MPNFVSFIYCITAKRIPYANSLCVQVKDKFCAFHVISVEFYNSANQMQGRVANITVLFSHCTKKKAALGEVQRSGPRHAIRQCEYRISFYQICIFEFAVKLRVADFNDKKIVTKSLTCWKRLVFVIEKQSREEEMQPIKKIYFSCFVYSTCKENEVSFRWLINYKSVKIKDIIFGKLVEKRKN